MTTKQPLFVRNGVLCPPSGGRFAAIIFDMGGTLLEFENVSWDALYPTSVQALHEALARKHKTLPSYDDFLTRFETLLNRRRQRIRSEMREYRIGPLLRELVQGFNIKIALGELDQIINPYYSAIRRQVGVYPESKQTLAKLKTLGYKVGLLSNTCFRARDHCEELQMFGLLEYFDATYFTSAGQFRKPHPDPFNIICRRLGVSPQESLYIGDRQYEDVKGPQGIGMTACLIRRNGKRYEEGLTDCCEIATLDDLLPRLGHA